MKRVASNKQIAWQIFAAGITMGLFLLMFKPFLTYHSMWAAGITSVASSIYLVYTQPTCSSANPANMILCYLLAFIIGLVLHWGATTLLALPISQHGIVLDTYLYCVVGMLAIVLMLIVSAYLAIPHPPAAGMALVLALRIDSWWLILALFVAILILAGCRSLLRNKLVDLWV